MSIALTDTSATAAPLNVSNPRRHGLLSVALTLTASHPSWLYGGLDVETVCGGAGVSTAFCLSVGDPPADKEPFNNQWPTLEPLAVYALHECSSIGKDWNSRLQDAQTALEIGEEAALEAFFAEAAVTDADTVDATSINEALYAAEDYAGYDAGRVIHLTPSNALRLSEFLEFKDGALTTKIGTPVVIGLGYVGHLDTSVLVTGTVLAASGETVVTDTVLERPSNLVSVLAEKPYALGHACAGTLFTVTP